MRFLHSQIQQLIEEINDNLHATSLNLKAALTSVDLVHAPQLHEELTYLQTLLQIIKDYASERQQLFLDFLMTSQIQQEEESVRRQRMQDYQQKIYEQRRIMTDKQTFFEALLRPKLKRHITQSTVEFQEMRKRVLQSEDNSKIQLLSKELVSLQKFMQFLEIQEHSQTVNTKADLIKNVCSFQYAGTAFRQAGSINQKDIPLQQQQIINSKSHRRTASVPYTVKRFPLIKVQVGQYLQNVSLKVLLNQTHQLKYQNEELYRIYEQQILSLRFKQRQASHKIQQYSLATEKHKQLNQKLKKTSFRNHWQHNRCFSPQIICRKVTSVSKQVPKFQ